MAQKKQRRGLLRRILDGGAEHDADARKAKPVTLEPALLQIGITGCPVCKHEVAVFLTKTKRPFINCGFCSARIFYNGRESMRRLRRKMIPVGGEIKLQNPAVRE